MNLFSLTHFWRFPAVENGDLYAFVKQLNEYQLSGWAVIYGDGTAVV